MGREMGIPKKPISLQPNILYDSYGTMEYTEVRTDMGVLDTTVEDLLSEWDLSDIATWDENIIQEVVKDYTNDNRDDFDVQDSDYDDMEYGESYHGGEDFKGVEAGDPPQGFKTWTDFLRFVQRYVKKNRLASQRLSWDMDRTITLHREMSKNKVPEPGQMVRILRIGAMPDDDPKFIEDLNRWLVGQTVRVTSSGITSEEYASVKGGTPEPYVHFEYAPGTFAEVEGEFYIRASDFNTLWGGTDEWEIVG